MAKNEWAKDAFRKAQNLMSKGYNDFEPATVITKDELSNLKNTLLSDDQIKQENKASWTNMENNPYNQAAETALARASDLEAEPIAYNPDDPEIEEKMNPNIEDLTLEVPDATSWDNWYKTFEDPESPAITQKEAALGKKLGADTIKVLEVKLISDPNLDIGEKVDIGVKIQSIKKAMKDLGS
jgi:hypothetical protein